MENRNIKKGSMIKENNRSNGRFVKYVSRLLALVMLLTSVLAFSGCDILSEKKEMQIKEDYVSQFNITDVAPEDVVVDYYAGNWNGYEIIMLDAECHRRELWEEKIGDVTLTYYDSNRLYAWSEGGFITLTDAYASNKLSMKDLERISKKFNKDVKYYFNTCDDYDILFGKQQNPLSEDLWADDKTYNMIYIIFPRDVLYDTDISYMPTWEPFIDFLGKDIVKDIIDFHVTSHDYRVCAKLRFNSERFRRYAIERLAKISGLVGLLPISSGLPPYRSASNEIASSMSEALNMIMVEKVWDFTKGSKKNFVGVIDFGIASHSALLGNLEEG